jgi:hypothetical protein
MHCATVLPHVGGEVKHLHSATVLPPVGAEVIHLHSVAYPAKKQFIHLMVKR